MSMRPNHSAALTLALLTCAGPSFAEDVARVLSVEGVSVVQRLDAQPRILGSSDTLAREDVINVGPTSHAIIEFTDQTQITLRPGTVFRMDALSSSRPDSLLKGLIKGGVRSAAFDARWCEGDCIKEEQRKPVTQAKPVARVVEMKGTVAAERGGSARLLVPGASVYEREGVATGANSYAVLAFSDGSRISLAANSQLSVPSFQFDYARHTGSAVVIHHAGEAMIATGKIAKQGPSFYRLITPLGEVKPLGTLIQSVAGGVQQAADQGADAARETGGAVVKAVQDTAGQAAQTALNAAITPILNTMSELMTRLRDNPPTTEAGWNDLKSQMTRTSDRLHGALDEAIRVGGAAADSREFKTVVGLALAAELQVVAVGASINNENGMGGDFMGPAAYATLVAMVAGAKASTYQSESLSLVGLSHADLDRVSSNRWAAHTIIAAEVGGYLASQGSTAVRNFFSNAEATTDELRQRAQQAEQSAAQAAAEAEQRAIEDEQRLAEEARAAAREAERIAAEAEELRQRQNEKLQEGQATLKEVADTAMGTGKVAVEHGKLGAGDAQQINGVNAQLQDLLQELNDLKAIDKQHDQRDAQNARGGVSQAWSGNTSQTGTGSPTQLVVWDGSVEVSGRIVRKNELLRRTVGGELILDPSSSALVTNAPRPDLVKVSPDLFDEAEIVSGSMTETITKKFERYGEPADGEHTNRDERNSRSEEEPPDGYKERYGEPTDGEHTNRDERNSRSEKEPSDGYKERYAYGASGTNSAPDLYVWVRDGVITLNRDGQQVTVSAGNAVVVTKDQVMLLDYVPNFLRFDRTPQPGKLTGYFELPTFVMPDGSLAGNCVAR